MSCSVNFSAKSEPEDTFEEVAAPDGARMKL